MSRSSEDSIKHITQKENKNAYFHFNSHFDKTASTCPAGFPTGQGYGGSRPSGSLWQPKKLEMSVCLRCVNYVILYIWPWVDILRKNDSSTLWCISREYPVQCKRTVGWPCFYYTTERYFSDYISTGVVANIPATSLLISKEIYALSGKKYVLSQVKVKVAQSCPTLCDPHGLQSMEFSSPEYQNTGVGSHSLLQGIFPNQGLNPGLPHCRWVLYQLSHQGIPRILDWVACPFSSGYSRLRNRTGVSCTADGFLTSWATREAPK